MKRKTHKFMHNRTGLMLTLTSTKRYEDIFIQNQVTTSLYVKIFFIFTKINEKIHRNLFRTEILKRTL